MSFYKEKKVLEAIKKHAPEVLKMTPEEREEWQRNREDDKNIDEVKEKIVLEVLPWYDKDKTHNNPKDLAKINAVSIQLNGSFISDDFFNWNECNFINLKETNLYTIDKNESIWQTEQRMKWDGLSEEDLAKLEKDKEYTVPNLSYWARTTRNKNIEYLGLDTLVQYLGDKIEDSLSNWVNEKIPNDYVSLPRDGEKVKGGFLWEMTNRANNIKKSYTLKAIQDYKNKIIFEELYPYLKEKYKNFDKVWIVENEQEKKDSKRGVDYEIVFSSVDNLKSVDTKTFWKDVEKIAEKDNSILDKIVSEESNIFCNKMEEYISKIKEENGSEIFNKINSILTREKTESENKISFNEKSDIIWYINEGIINESITFEEYLESLYKFLTKIKNKDIDNVYFDYIDSLTFEGDRHNCDFSSKRYYFNKAMAFLNMALEEREFKNYNKYVRTATISLFKGLNCDKKA